MAELRQYEALEEATDQQRSWFFRYLENGFHATEAARFAKYSDPGQSGWENKIRLEKLIQAELKKKVMSADEALAGLSDIARASLLDVSRVRGEGEETYVALSLEAAVENGKGHLVKDVRFDKWGTLTKLGLHDALKARELILKVHGAFRENGDAQKEASIEAAKSWADALAEARAAHEAKKDSK